MLLGVVYVIRGLEVKKKYVKIVIFISVLVFMF